MSDPVMISADGWRATIHHRGAELRALTGPDGAQWLHDGNPDWWHGIAPLLFPVVGAVANDRIRVGDAAYPMAKHGIARKADFAVVEQGAAHVTMRLSDGDTGRTSYPFDFELHVTHRLAPAQLTTEVRVANPGAETLPFSVGFHPAFAWPLPGGAGRAHRVHFAAPEPQAIRRIDPASGLILPEPQPSPVDGATLVPTPALFEPDAIIWDALNSRSLTFGVDGGPAVALDFPDCPMLGIWQKPGAPFLCLEPWAGHADPAGYAGDFTDKPGSMLLAPGDERTFRLTMTLCPHVSG